jgi:hypothetical protein
MHFYVNFRIIPNLWVLCTSYFYITQYEFRKIENILHTYVNSLISRSPPSTHFAYQSVHKCLVFLGDIGRYKDQHAIKSSKSFYEATLYYTHAILLQPSNGNAYNQVCNYILSLSLLLTLKLFITTCAVVARSLSCIFVLFLRLLHPSML